MPRPPLIGLLDAAMAALCIWAAGYHTPIGALARSVGGWALGVRSSARPLLAYYSAGVYDAPPQAPDAPHLDLDLRGPIPADEALSQGICAAAAKLSPSERAPLIALLGGAPPTPTTVQRALVRLTDALGSRDAAVAALFWGEPLARYARDWARSEGHALELAELARQLPPGHGQAVTAASRALTLGAVYALAWPVPETTRVSSPFGYRLHPILGTRKLHTGVDSSVPRETEVHATAAGIVRRASEDAVNGRVVIIDHGHGVTTAYCHNQLLLVHTGDCVERGQVISRSGSTGRSTGPHLHYQLDLGGVPVDPFAYRVARAPPESKGRGDEAFVIRGDTPG